MSEAGVDRKPRIATVWLGGCSGCHMSFLDLDERLMELAQLADIVFTPIADMKTFPENVDVTVVEGAVANEDHVALLQQVRSRTRVLASLGDCAITGNVTALRNVWPVEAVLTNAYVDRARHSEGVPQPGDILPRLTGRVAPLHHVVSVDEYIPGCPPDADRIWQALLSLLRGEHVHAEDMPAPKFG